MDIVEANPRAPLSVTLRFTDLEPGGTCPWIDVIIIENNTSKFSSVQAAGLDFNYRWTSEPLPLIRRKTHLYLEKIEKEEIEALAAALSEGLFPYLQVLEFRHCTFGDEGLESLLKGISAIQRHLHTFIVWGSGVTEHGAEALASMLRQGYFSHLQVLDLSDNSLGSVGSLALFQTLEVNALEHLRKLDFYNVGLSTQAAIALSRAIASKKLPNLRKMYFGLNSIGDEGFKALLSPATVVLLGNLEEWFVDRNGITDEGALVFENVVMAGNLPNLQELHLWGSSIGPRGAQALARALRARAIPSRALWLDMNEVGEGGGQGFIDALVQNSHLTTDVKLDWKSDTVRDQADRARGNNLRLSKILERLGGQQTELMPANHGKVIVCGYGQVGKTTLTSSIKLFAQASLRSKSVAPKTIPVCCLPRGRSLFSAPTRLSSDIKPTRGIEVCAIQWQGNDSRRGVINLWDLGGQSEFHILHSTFLSYAGMGEGDPTTFLLVCRADYVGHSENLRTSENELRYWLRFIASCDLSGRKRRVVLVLNRFHGTPCHHQSYWKELLNKLRVTFKDTIHVHDEFFIEDCRDWTKLLDLNRTIVAQVGAELEKMKIPVICNSILSVLRAWASTPQNKSFPVLRFRKFVEMLLLPEANSQWAMAIDEALETISTDAVKAAIEYLHEVGDVVYFPEDSKDSVIVVAPQWLCQNIVGQILVPIRWLKPGEKVYLLRQNMKSDGSISITDVNAYLSDQVEAANEEQVQDLMAILMRLGLCYRVGKENLLFPALVESTYGEVGCWEKIRVRGQCVMGRALKLVESETSALPMHFFSSLQIELKQGLGNDSEYCAGRSHVSYMEAAMAVLLEFYTDEMDASNDRIDILVKPLTPNGDDDVDRKAWRHKQLLLVDTLWEKLVNLSRRLLGPGIQFSKRVIKPFGAFEGTPTMKSRSIDMTVDEVKRNVIKQGANANSVWVMPELGCVFTYSELLSFTERREVDEHMTQLFHHAKELCNEEFKRGSIGRPPQETEKRREEIEVEMARHGDYGSARTEPGRVDELVTWGHGEGSKLDKLEALVKELGNKQDASIAENRKGFQDLSNKMDNMDASIAKNRKELQHLLTWMQAQARFLEQEKDRSVPRFMYVIEKPRTALALRKTFMLHLMCEQENGKFHHIQEQEGMPVTCLKHWARGGLKCLKWSLTVIGCACLAGGLVVPGLQLAAPAFATASAVASSTCQALTMTIDKLVAEVDRSFHGEQMVAKSANSSSKAHVLEAEGELKDWLSDVLGPLVAHRESFAQMFGLHRVTVLNADESRREVLWICADCRRSYGSSIVDAPSLRPFH